MTKKGKDLEPTNWDFICEQINKIRFKKTHNPWTHPIKEDFDDVVVSAPSDLTDRDAETYSSTDMFNRQDYPKKQVRKIKKQLRKKKPKEKNVVDEVELSLLLSDDGLKDKIINSMTNKRSVHHQRRKK